MAQNWHRNLRDLQLCLQTSLFYLACQPLCPRGYIYSNPAHHPLVCGYTLSEALPLPTKENSLLAQLADWLESEFASVKARSNTCMCRGRSTERCKDWTFCFAIFLPLHISKYYNVPYTNIQFICNFVYGYYMYHMCVTIYYIHMFFLECAGSVTRTWTAGSHRSACCARKTAAASASGVAWKVGLEICRRTYQNRNG